MSAYSTPVGTPSPKSAAPSGFVSPAPAAAHKADKPTAIERLDNVAIAGRRTLASLPTVRQVLHETRRTLHHTVPGMGIAAASSWAFARTVTPGLLRASVNAADVAGTLQTLPVVGGLAARVLGAGGHFGLWSGAFCLLSASLALLTGQGSFDKRLKWALAHVTQGFALSPFWLMAASGTFCAALPGALLAVGCMVGVSMVLAQVMAGDRPSWTSGVLLAALTTAGGPLGAQLALGTALVDAVTTAGFSLALGALAGTFLIWSSNFAALEDDSTALFRKYEVKRDPSRVLAMPGENKPNASVFVSNVHLQEKINSIRVNIRLGGSLHNERMLLCGKPGNGKSVLAKSIQNEFGWPMSAPPASIFVDSDKPATLITEVMEQARREADRRGAPVGLVFDEAEKLFPNRQTMRDAGTVRADQAWMMTTTFNDLFEGVGSGRYANVFVVVLTNHKETTDAAFLSRFSGQRTIELEAPDDEGVHNILRTRWQTEHNKYEGLKYRFQPFVPTAAAVGRMAAASQEAHATALPHRLSGRDLDEAVNAALTAANGHFAGPAADKKATQADFEAFLLARFVQAVQQHRTDSAHLAEAASRLPAKAATAANDDDNNEAFVLQQMAQVLRLPNGRALLRAALSQAGAGQ